MTAIRSTWEVRQATSPLIHPQKPQRLLARNTTVSALNHIGIVVDGLDAVEQKVIARGYVPNSHQDYEPGRRFYFEDENSIEIEVISYA
jgi:hypothetical protein